MAATPSKPINSDELDDLIIMRIAEETSKRTMNMLLTSLGIDLSNPIQAQQDFAALREISHMLRDPEFQADMTHMRKWRKTMESVGSNSRMAIIGILVSGFVGMVWLGLKETLKRQ